MSRRLLKTLITLAVLALATSAWAASKDKDSETLMKANTVLQAMLNSKSVPTDVLKKAECIIVLPSVKKFGIGIGGSGGRGPMVCKTAPGGTWSAPAMYSVGGVSAGLQVGGSSTDYVLLVMTKKGVDALLKGKMNLGREATAAAGPGATASGDIGADILTYGRASGLFAGVSLGGADLQPDNDANKRIYEKAVTVDDILMKHTVTVTEAGKPLDTLLNSHTAAPKAAATKPAKAKPTTKK
jgi:SH3 domain-containing YSC84-like protein 1